MEIIIICIIYGHINILLQNNIETYVASAFGKIMYYWNDNGILKLKLM